ncbi:hypothetical protein HRbin30_01569 [bacterium HR30]|nr:hypothetical protein HRbin30_01569 [bacterium HR30]
MSTWRLGQKQPGNGADAEESRTFRRKTLSLLGLLTALLAGAVSVSPLVGPLWVSAMLVVGAVALAAVSVPRTQRLTPEQRFLPWLGIGAAFVVASWFRLRYWQTVPAGYLGEVLNFVNFAQSLLDQGFPYQPYAWYAHTLFSYAIAAVGAFVPDPLIALRIAQILISLLTVAAIAWCAWVLFGSQAAWLSTALLATSWWHVWATRNGYHQFLTPLFQALVLGGLVQGLRDKKRVGFWVAAIGIAGGLHAYWALYLLPPFAALLVLLFAWRQPAAWRAVRWSVLWAGGVALLLSFPAVWATANAPEGFSYVRQGLSPARVGATTTLEKLLHNASFLQQALWPSLGHADVPPALLDYFLRGGVVLGFGITLRRAWREIPAAATVLLFTMNLAGLLIASANEFYVIAIFVPLFLFAGSGYAALLDASRRVSKYLAWVALVSFLLAWGYFGYAGVERFFRVWADTMFRSPKHPQGLAFLLLPHWRSCVREANCAVPAGEPGRDFEEEALLLSVNLPNYRWLHGLGRVYSDSILFAPIQLMDGRPLRLVLPASRHVEQRLWPSWQAFYPEATKAEIHAPPPWDTPEPRVLAVQVEIPFSALHRRYATNTPASVSQAIFWAPDPGFYEFRSLVPGIAAPSLHKLVPLTGPIYLGRGYHPIEFPWLGWGWSGWQVRRFGLGWEAVDHYLLAVTETETSVHLSNHLGRVAKPVLREWKLRRTLSLPGAIWDMAFCPDRSVSAVIAQRLYEIDVTSGAATALTLMDVPDPSIRCTASGTDIVGRDGSWWRWRQGILSKIGQLPCSVRQIAKSNGPLTTLCTDARLWFETSQEVPLQDRTGQPLPQPVAIERCHDRIYVLDSALAELLSYNDAGQLLGSQAVSHVWWDSELTCEDGRNLYILQWQRGRSAYDSTGALLYHSQSHVPWLFTRNGSPFNGFSFRRFVCNGELAVWTRDLDLEVLERVPITAQAP